MGDPVTESVYSTPAPVPVVTTMSRISQEVGVVTKGGVTVTAEGHHVVTRTPGTHHTVIFVDPRSMYYE